MKRKEKKEKWLDDRYAAMGGRRRAKKQTELFEQWGTAGEGKRLRGGNFDNPRSREKRERNTTIIRAAGGREPAGY